MPPKPALREPDRGLRFLEDKLSVYVHGPSQTRRNPALDLLTGRVPDTRLQPPAIQAAAPAARPATVVLPRVAVGVARGRALATTRPATLASSPWLDAIQPAAATPRLRLVAPPPAKRSPMTYLAPALAFVVVCAIALGIGLTIRGLRQSEPIVVTPTTTAPAQPTVAPTIAPTAAPTTAPTAAPTLAPTQPPAPRAPEAPAQADQFRLMVDERFGQPSLPWPNQPSGTTWLASGAYHLSPRQPGRFVAVGVPGATDLADVVVSGAFTKIDGPDGGGYGLILRDQSPSARDGQAQDGRFYVFEIGDKGELGIWLRDGDHWVDLLPWTPNDAVHPGRATNELTVSAIGATLAFTVNGIPVATQRDQTLHHGGVALFTGGDNNHVAVEHLTIRVPR